MRLNNARHVDHVVIGLGGLGSAAAYWLPALPTRRGCRTRPSSNYKDPARSES